MRLRYERWWSRRTVDRIPIGPREARAVGAAIRLAYTDIRDRIEVVA